MRMSLSNNIVWSPVDYSEACVLAREAGEEMLSRLDWMTLQPSVILDIGCGIGEMSARLQTRYQTAQVLAFDAAITMAQYAHEHHAEIDCVCADGATLPLRDQTVDLIVANFLLPWYANSLTLLREWRRVLRPNGLLLFTALGPDTLKQWRGVLADAEVPQRVDMHDIGDLLLQAGFADPVLDVDHYTMTYREKKRFFHELRASGMWFSSESMDVDSVDDACEATYEVIFAHAFTPAASEEITASSDGVVRVPLAQMRQQLAKK